MRSSTRRRVLGAALTASAAIALPVRAATVHVWPGSAPCAGTLQACINAAPVGDVVEVATAGPIDESISFEKPLTLRAQSGVTPSFTPGQTVFGGIVSGSGTIRIEGLVLPQGAISIFQASSGTLTAQIVGNVIHAPRFDGPAFEIGAAGGSLGTVSAAIVGNRTTVPTGDQTSGILVSLSGVPGADVAVSSNNVQMGSNSQGAAIDIDALGTVDVFGNEISGAGYNNGIRFDATAGATVRVFNNVVFGQAGNVGGPGGIVIDADDQTIEALIGLNTLVNNEIGIDLDVRTDLGGYVEGGVIDNLLVGNGIGIRLFDDVLPTVVEHHNLFFDNQTHFGDGVDSYPLGAGDVVADPHLDADLRPTFGSPAIDAGDTGFVPQDLVGDVRAAPRVQGSAVDIGAFEAPEPAAALAPVGALLALGALRIGRARRALDFITSHEEKP